MIISNFSIFGLYGHFSIDVPIKNNRLVLVGENGSGKSSFVLLLYYLLSKQWEKLEVIQFEKLTIEMDNEGFTFIKDDISKYNNAKIRRTSNYPFELVSSISQVFSNLNLPMTSKALNNALYYNTIQENTRARIPMSVYNDIIRLLIDDSSRKKFPSIIKFEEYISKNIDYHLLFLPTYRRIEKDFDVIFPDKENFMNERSIRRINRTNIEQNELVAFGMQDIVNIIDLKMRSLNNYFRSSLQSMISKYLLDVLGNKYNDINISTLDYNEFENIDVILDKIGGEILPDEEKNLVIKKIENLKKNREETIENKITLDFILKIISLQKDQIKLESDVELFVSIANKYLVNKVFVFDRSAYQLYVHNTLTNDKVELNNLSSGEKQVVAIFAHLFLREKNKYFLIFDEPELSLSVPWQKTFLEDISQSKNCSGVIAVTHSPFIYDNTMEQYCTSINEHFTVG